MPHISLSKNEIRNRLNSMRIKPAGFKSRKYGVSVKFFENGEPEPRKRIDYEAVAELEIINGIGEICINKENIWFNQHEPDLINEIIADAVSKSFYPVKTHINEKGISSDEIINYSEVIERWHSEKDKILQKYSSPELEKLISKTEQNFLSKNRLEQSLRYDWYWNLFFHPKLINYGDLRSVEQDLYLSVIPYHYPLRFSGIQTIEKIPTDYHSFTVNFQSEEIPAPKYFYPKNLEANLQLYMNLNVFFDLDVYHHFPMHTRAYLEIFYKDNMGHKINVKKVQFTMYQINTDEYEGKILDSDSPFITGGLVKIPPNKWGFDNFENLENNW